MANEKGKLEAILEYMSNGVIAFDFDGRLMHINPKALELLSCLRSYHRQVLAKLKLGTANDILRFSPGQFGLEFDDTNNTVLGPIWHL